MSARPTVSVVVPARDAAATLPECLAGLAREGVPGPGAELIVVDDGSRDATAALAERAGARVLHSDGRGPAVARNLAARAAASEVLVFLDADTVPRSGWLEALVAPLADPSVVAVKGRYYSGQRALAARFAQLEFEEKYDLLARARSVDFIDTGTAAFRRDAFFAAGGFDEGFRLPSAEDVELGFRLVAGGGRIAFSPAAAVDHRHPASMLAYLRRKARYGRFRAAVYRRHPSKALGDAYTPRVVPLQIVLAGLAWGLALVAPGRRRVGWALAAALGLFGATTAPLVARAGRADPPLAPLVPALVFARATAQGLGLALGVAAQAGTAVAERLRRPGC